MQYDFQIRVTGILIEDGKILLVQQRLSENRAWSLPGGRLEQGETLEQGVVREFKEETKLNTVKFKFMSSRYHEPRNVLMLNFLSMAENGEPEIDAEEIDEVRWFTFDEALGAVRKESTAEFFLKNAIAELKKNNF